MRYVRTIWRGLDEDMHVFECIRCGGVRQTIPALHQQAPLPAR